MSWLLSPNGCRGRIRESLLHPLRRKFPPACCQLGKRATARAHSHGKQELKQEIPELLHRKQASHASRPALDEWCAHSALLVRAVTAMGRWCGGARLSSPHCPPAPWLCLTFICLPSVQPVDWIRKPGNHLSEVVLNMTKSHLACSSEWLLVLAFFIHFSFPCQEKDCFFHLLEEKSLGC